MSKTLPDRDERHDFLLNKNTPSMMATKIFKNMTRDIFGVDACYRLASQINIQIWSLMCDIATLFVYFSYVIPSALLCTK